MMSKTEILIRSILNTVRTDIRPLACTLDVIGEKIAEEGLDWSELCVTKDIYPVVARRLGKQPSSVARSAERIANQCWEEMDQWQTIRYLGKPIDHLRAPSELMFYLAFFARHGKPYYRVIRERVRRYWTAEGEANQMRNSL